MEAKNIEFLASSCMHSYVSSVDLAGVGGQHTETLYSGHYFSVLDNWSLFQKGRF